MEFLRRESSELLLWEQMVLGNQVRKFYCLKRKISINQEFFFTLIAVNLFPFNTWAAVVKTSIKQGAFVNSGN